MKVCIICEKEIQGKAVAVKEDRIIRVLRTIKKTFNVAKMNDLYVCEEDKKKHEERRKSFEKGVLFASIGAGIVIVILLAKTILTGAIEAWSILSGLILAGFIILLPLFRYTPAVEGMNSQLLPLLKGKNEKAPETKIAAGEVPKARESFAVKANSKVTKKSRMNFKKADESK
ncbi:hypothetical protein HY988_03495 [Candidatus Micrarchaeota archaeon]|nr:hypothetical protein [Candidatus Micrarchaeota archaeon]